jgi:phosphoglycolate phosphatase
MYRVKYDALIFDLDGTLWDAAPASTEGWNRALAQLRLPIKLTPAEIRSVAGNPTPRCFEILLPALMPMADETYRLFERREREAIEAVGGVLFDGVVEGMQRLSSAYPLFLVSNCLEWYLDFFLRFSGLAPVLAGWDCHGCSGEGKVGMFRTLTRRHGLDRAVYVGDTQGDRDAAVEAGLSFAFARYGFGDVTQAAPAFDSFADLVSHFLA